MSCMKKLLLATLVLAVIALVPAKEVEITSGKEIHLHKHAEAYSVTWQCRNCGQQIYSSSKGQPPRASYGCGGEFNRQHVWERLN